ncbi:hypothetical protein OSB04_029083 [Centaurea solstitialis]|uniref:ADP-ribosyl cyclase/cyclic ADP-ribose hydrolase n=1 Tax=Centaurea solstitialis TaxID=347529 RepID=A0AA38T0K1_9ASTR|nr:hypothetical protein OSB04_029083 [Centaurea solstitialis]
MAGGGGRKKGFGGKTVENPRIFPDGTMLKFHMDSGPRPAAPVLYSCEVAEKPKKDQLGMIKVFQDIQRGEDTRNNFVDHLHTSLVQKGIRVFKDDEMLRRGKRSSSELLKAIEESRFAVVVFSENYTISSWCLDELAKIMDCQDRMGQKKYGIWGSEPDRKSSILVFQRAKLSLLNLGGFPEEPVSK